MLFLRLRGRRRRRGSRKYMIIDILAAAAAAVAADDFSRTRFCFYDACTASLSSAFISCLRMAGFY